MSPEFQLEGGRNRPVACIGQFPGHSFPVVTRLCQVANYQSMSSILRLGLPCNPDCMLPDRTGWQLSNASMAWVSGECFLWRRKTRSVHGRMQVVRTSFESIARNRPLSNQVRVYTSVKGLMVWDSGVVSYLLSFFHLLSARPVEPVQQAPGFVGVRKGVFTRIHSLALL